MKTYTINSFGERVVKANNELEAIKKLYEDSSIVVNEVDERTAELLSRYFNRSVEFMIAIDKMSDEEIEELNNKLMKGYVKYLTDSEERYNELAGSLSYDKWEQQHIYDYTSEI